MKLPWLWIIGSMIFYGIGEWSSKAWATGVSKYLFVVAIMAYALNAMCWMPALKQHGGLAILGTIYASLYALITILIGTLIFQEPLTIKQWVGIVFAIIAVSLLG